MKGDGDDGLRGVVQAVSYTHLDVYKRQVLKSVEPIPNLNLIGVDFRGASFDNETLRDMVAASGGVL